jgi:hypothetical protein
LWTGKEVSVKRVLQAAATALFIAAAWSPAQALVIGTADPGKADAIPFGQTIGGSVYQQVYNATNFSSSMLIDQITFYNSSAPGGTPMTGNFDIYLSVTNAPVGGLPTDVPAGFPGSLSKVFSGSLPSLSNGRLDFDLLSSFFYDPTKGNLLLTIVSFDHVQQPNPLLLDTDMDAGTLFSRRLSVGGGKANLGLVTGFNDSVAPVPGPLVGAGLPGLILAGAGVFVFRRRRKPSAA